MSEKAVYRALFDLSPSAIALEDEHGTILDVNPALCRILGYTREELVGASVRTFVPAEAHPAIDRHLAQILNGQVLFHVVTNIRKDGTRVALELHEGLATLPDGKRCVLVIANDVTERVKTEEALRESRLFIEKIAETSPNALYLFDVQTGKEVYSTPRMAELLGYTQREWTDQPAHFMSPLLHPDDRKRVASHVKDWGAAPYGLVRTCQYRLRHKDGSWRWFVGSDTVFSHDERGRTKLIVGTAQDITEQKDSEEVQRRIEHQMFMSQKLDSLGLMAGGVAHDFNNMLLTILGNIELAVADIPEDSPLRPGLAQAANAGRRAAGLCQQLLAYSGKGHFDVAPLNINDLVRDFDPMLRASVSRKIDVSYELGLDLPLVNADASQLRQVILNLVINASEAMDDRTGTITIATEARKLDAGQAQTGWLPAAPPAGRYALLTVIDCGCGIPPEVLPRIFEPFYTSKFIGRGLGLPAVMGIVQGHRGAIRVESTVGRGSCFEIVLPAAATAAAEMETSDKHEDDGRLHGTVLVVVDEQQVRLLAERMLRHMGLDVVLAAGSDEALDLIQTKPEVCDCVLLDLTMPADDGAEALVQLRRIKPDAAVILVSGYTESDVLHRLRGVRHDAFLQKPYTLETLRSAVQRVLRRP